MAESPLRHVFPLRHSIAPRLATLGLALTLIATPTVAQTVWRQRARSPGVTWLPAVAYDPVRGNTVVFGGSPDASVVNAHNRTWLWDGTEWHEAAPAHRPSPRVLAAMAFDTIRGRCLVFGGNIGLDLRTDDLWAWTGSDWLDVSPPVSGRPPARREISVAFDSARDRLVLFGGDVQGVGRQNDTWEYDGQAGTWTQRFPAAAPTPRQSPILAYDPARQRVVLFGGDAIGYTNDTWTWDGTNWTDMQPAHRPPIRNGGGLVWVPARQRLLLFGGSNGAGLADTWEWDGSDWTQLSPSAAPSPRSAPLVWDSARGRGVLVDGAGLGDLWEWDGSTWNDATPHPSARSNHAVAWDETRQRVLLFGGVNSRSGVVIHDDTWEWDGVRWTRRTSAQRPPARFDHALAFLGNRAVLFGGEDASGTRNDTWEWDGTTWAERQLTQAERPPARARHALVPQPLLGTVLLCGGNSGATWFDDLWEWNGSRWTQLAVPSRPPVRIYAGSAYDGRTGRALWFGGENASAQALGDLWSWDGRRWSSLAGAGPAARLAGAMAFDQARMRLVLFGGTADHVTRLADTWEWDGVAWTPQPPMVAPAGRQAAAMAHDVARGRCVLFGGTTSQGWSDETWDYGAVAPASVAPGRPGCAGSAGVPRLDTEPFGLPWLGWQWRTTLTGVPATTPAAVVWIGTSDQQWNGLTLPLALDALGLPGCALGVAPDLPLLVANLGGHGTAALAIPEQRDLIGLALHQQAVVPDAAANAARASLSNTLAARIGAR